MRLRSVTATVLFVFVVSGTSAALAGGNGVVLPPPAGRPGDPGAPDPGLYGPGSRPTNPWDLPMGDVYRPGAPAAPGAPAGPAPAPGAPAAPGAPGAPGAPAPPPPPPPTPEEIAEELVGRLDPPVPDVHTNPPSDGDQLVGLPTWLWVSNWAPVSVSEAGVTVTARPVATYWDLGAGDPVVECGRGTPYDTSRSPDEQDTDCSYTYQYTSADQPGGVYDAAVSMVWAVSWTGPGGTGGSFGYGATETGFSLRAVEVQALVGT